mmetsp:Transcript_17016/g.23807  ORF Transcript_17016/g.23807 Transcript_17016/m.23807 type:complete len:181 (+) Transcript_17016:84-626(+)|eukprot:CAMPEP_0184478558 /NCGR_PEP_ID=MMETSP0113_2-20130426/556_1 /TAXON_ID=91329 /ORGANISM="Norrisiella sphaerica, Strain BC52" /LENGTH=180 /DNA_ID=CAMNT_0026856399 /DNA_START=84 /DNA_END=626 /DNA_ORIENTATION=+
MPEDNQPAYGTENDSLVNPDERKSERITPPSEAKVKGKKRDKCSIFLLLNWIGIVLTLGYFGYATGMLFGFAHKGPDALRVCVTYIFMMLFSMILFLCEMRVSFILDQFKFLTTPFGLAVYYALLGVFALIDDRAWWKWVLFAPMVTMGAAYILGASCSHDIKHDFEPIPSQSRSDVHEA